VEVTWKYYMKGGEGTNNSLKKGTKIWERIEKKI